MSCCRSMGVPCTPRDRVHRASTPPSAVASTLLARARQPRSIPVPACLAPHTREGEAWQPVVGVVSGPDRMVRPRHHTDPRFPDPLLAANRRDTGRFAAGHGDACPRTRGPTPTVGLALAHARRGPGATRPRRQPPPAGPALRPRTGPGYGSGCRALPSVPAAPRLPAPVLVFQVLPADEAPGNLPTSARMQARGFYGAAVRASCRRWAGMHGLGQRCSGRGRRRWMTSVPAR